MPDQARWAPLLVVLALPACTERLNELNPVPFFDNLFNASHLQGREPPPGLDGPWPNLSSVPPRPEPPDPATRARVSAGLAEDRQQSRTPLGVMPGSRPAASDPGSGPPPPPRLAAVPPLRLEPVPAPQPAPAAAPVVPQPAPAPAAPAPVRAPEPAAPPPAPAPALLAPPPPPGRDLLAPPPPPNPDLLAPRRN